MIRSLATLLLSLLFVLPAACAPGAETGADEGADADAARPLPVAVQTVRYQDAYEAERRFAGRVLAARVADLAFQVGGEVAEMDVEVGDRVAADQPLARLDAARLTLGEAQAQAGRAEAVAALTRAEAALGRVERLFADGYATAQERDDARAERDGARERVRALGRAAGLARADLRDAVLRAPFGGTVVAREADVGDTVAPGQRVLRVNADGALEAEIGVPAADARRLRPGDEVSMSARSGPLTATVTSVGDDVDAATRTVPIRFALPDGTQAVPGELVRLALSDRRAARGAWVPLDALQESYRGLWSVYVIAASADGPVARREDVVILSATADRAFVSGTLNDGDRIVAEAPFRLVPGQRVRPVERAPGGALAAQEAR